MIQFRKIIFFLYGILVYIITLGTLAYMIGFMGNFLVPNTIDGAQKVGTFQAIIINSVLLLIFAIQHSVMARQSFKKAWTRIIPKPIERSTYVLMSCVALLLLFFFWEPIDGMVWNVQSETGVIVLYCIYFLGWSMVFFTTFLISHWDLFGLRQVYLYLVGRPYTAVDFTVPFFYKKIRHPLYLGFLITFWATPTMSLTHLFFSILFTAYVFMAINLEEKDLVYDFKERYVEYKKKVPMILPIKRKV